MGDPFSCPVVAGFSTSVTVPWGHWAMSGDTIGCHNWGSGRLGMLLNTLQCTGWSPPQEGSIPNVNGTN